MAIVRKEDKKEKSLPKKLEAIVNEAFQFQALRDWYGRRYSEKRDTAVSALEHEKDIELVVGEGFRTENGMVIVTEPEKFNFDIELMWKAVKKGKVSEEAFLNCISTFNASKVKAAFQGVKGAMTPANGDSPKMTVTMKANPDYKKKLMKLLGKVKEKDNLFKKLS